LLPCSESARYRGAAVVGLSGAGEQSRKAAELKCGKIRALFDIIK